MVCQAKKEVGATGCYIVMLYVSFPILKCGCEKQPTLIFFLPKALLPLSHTPLHAPRKVKQVIFIRVFIGCIYSVDMVSMQME